MGQSPSSIFINEDSLGVPFLQANADFGDVTPQPHFWCTRPNKIASEDDLLLSIRAPVGEINIADQDYCIGRGLSSISFFGIDRTFGYYAIQQNLSFLHLRSQGSTFLAVNKKDVSELPLFVPTGTAADKEQAKIAEVLTAIDAVIEKTKALIAKYQKIKEGMLQDLLTNGIDERGQIRSPKTHKYKPSRLGMIPVEWECGPLSDIAKINPRTSKKGIKTNELVTFIPMEDVSEEGRWIYKEKVDFLVCSSGYTAFMNNDVLFAKITPCMENGKGCLVEDSTTIGFGSTEFHVLRAKTLGDASFIYYWTISRRLREKAVAYMTGSAGQQRVDAKFFTQFLIGIPLKKEQGWIASKMRSVDMKLEREKQVLLKLELQKQGLMQDLLTNKVSVEPLLRKGGIA